jgi:hypothetical protein
VRLIRQSRLHRVSGTVSVVVSIHTIPDVFCRTNIKAVVSATKDIDIVHRFGADGRINSRGL